jgi:hypothetical protein
LDSRHSDRGRGDGRLARRANVRLLAQSGEPHRGLRIHQNESPQVCASWGLRSVGSAGKGVRNPRTCSNGRSGRAFRCLLVIVRPLRNTRRGVAFRYFGLGAVVVGVQRPHGACPAVPAASAQHGRPLPPTNCADWPKSMRSARHPSERARRCLRMPRRIHPSHNSSSSHNTMPSWSRRLPLSVLVERCCALA